MAILYFDGASRGNPGISAAACVLISKTNRKTIYAKNIGDNKTNNYAEYSALIMGLQLAIVTGHTQIEVFGDSLLVINQITGKWRARHVNIKPLWKDAMTLLAKFERVSASYIPRRENKLADKAANDALDAYVERNVAITQPKCLDVVVGVARHKTLPRKAGYSHPRRASI